MKKYQSEKTKLRKVRKQTNVGGSTEGRVQASEGRVQASEGSTEARRKDDNGCTELRHSEEVPALI